jgi:hypothetical protein
MVRFGTMNSSEGFGIMQSLKSCYAHYHYTITLTHWQEGKTEGISADAHCLKMCKCLTKGEANELPEDTVWEDALDLPLVGETRTTHIYETKDDCSPCPTSDCNCNCAFPIPIWDQHEVTDAGLWEITLKELLRRLEHGATAAVITAELLDDIDCKKNCAV